jgi:hypothetical protein
MLGLEDGHCVHAGGVEPAHGLDLLEVAEPVEG